MPATPTEQLHHLGIRADELAASGALWTAREIEQQPHMLQRTHAFDRTRRRYWARSAAK